MLVKDRGLFLLDVIVDVTSGAGELWAAGTDQWPQHQPGRLDPKLRNYGIPHDARKGELDRD